MIRKLLKITGFLVLALVIGLAATWLWYNEELQVLDAKKRATFNEDFIELPQGVVRYELGGQVTTRFTNLHPEKVRQLVLVDPMVYAPSSRR